MVVALNVATGLAGWGSGPGPAVVAADSPEVRVIVLVNQQRAQQGLPALVVSDELTASAEAYAREMATQNFFAHVAPDASTFVSRDEAAGYLDWTYLEENLAAGMATPDSAVAAWMASPPHRAYILSPNVLETGVGFYVQPGSHYVYYWVQEFGNRPSVERTAGPLARALVAASPATWLAPTGFRVTGDWLAYVRGHGDQDTFGLPLSDAIVDPQTGRQTQYFQRAILEWHAEFSPGQQIRPRLLGDVLYPGADPPVSSDDRPPGPATYFPFSANAPTGLGHFVADYTRAGQAIHFKEFFDSHGGVASFGYPKEEPALRDGLWTQRFQAAVFQYHPEYDHPGYEQDRVQLELLGDEYVRAQGLSFAQPGPPARPGARFS